MSTVEITKYLLVGLGGGVFAGFFGVGGGIVLVPVLIWIFGFSQHQAQGLSLMALVLPVGLLGAMKYYKGHVIPIQPALWLALGLCVGGYFGGTFAQMVSGKALRIAFGTLTIVAGVKLILGK